MISPSTRSFLKPCPAKGVHPWLYYAAHRCLDLGLSEEEATPLLRELMTRDERPSNEIEATFQSIRAELLCEPRESAPRWAKRNDALIEAIAKAGPTLLELWDMSPVKLDDGRCRTEELIDLLFPGNPLLCVGKAQWDFNTKPREYWRGILGYRQFIVPSPMTAITGRKRSGGISEHTLDNTGDRRFLAIEFDDGGLDQQAALLHYLSTKAPLAMATYSGGKSTHGWFPCAGEPEEKLWHFMNLAVTLGADKATWSRSQFVRIPDARREEAARKRVPLPDAFRPVPADRQAAVYFNPEVIR